MWKRWEYSTNLNKTLSFSFMKKTNHTRYHSFIAFCKSGSTLFSFLFISASPALSYTGLVGCIVVIKARKLTTVSKYKVWGREGQVSTIYTVGFCRGMLILQVAFQLWLKPDLVYKSELAAIKQALEKLMAVLQTVLFGQQPSVQTAEAVMRVYIQI